jgi:hypothetical protein
VAALIVVALIASWLVWPSAGPARKYANGPELANVWLRRAAENNGIAETSGIADKLCVVPEGIGVTDFSLQKWFSGFSVSYRAPEADRSEGYWFILIGLNATRELEIYAIPQTVLLWDAPGNVPASTLYVCPSQFVISKEGGTVFLSSGPKRVPRIELMRN